jgi:hypothetical protein
MEAYLAKEFNPATTGRGFSGADHARLLARLRPLRAARPPRRTASCLLVLFSSLVLILGPVEGSTHPDRVSLFPKLQSGQTLTYRIAYHVDKQAKTQSSVVMAQSPGAPSVDVQALLRLEVLDVSAAGSRTTIHARTRLQILNPETNPAAPNLQRPPAQDDQGPAIEFTLSPNGRIAQIKGLDALTPDQQQAWQQWSSRFAAAGDFPENGIKPTQKWKSEEPETSSSPITGLTWIRESTYLRNEPCRAAQITMQGEVSDAVQPPETCVVIQTTAALKQKSSPNNTTPEDFKLHQLRTTGTATGNNKTLLYISLQTGLLIRSSDQADQTMDVTIAKSDKSNQVRYNIHAKSTAEIFRIANSPPNHW